ncbi:uncharacterized protein [Palaemon carinicauda]|uniref:uncharacterized protein n=1 Tax=Palaemon carinicauda TaxID=392227 RepID=UPI0035B59E6B
MASRACFRATRFLTSLRTTGPLKPPATQTVQHRTLRSFPGLFGAQAVKAKMDAEETNTYLGDFEESFQRWQEEAQMLRDIRLLPEDLELSKIIEEASKEQLLNILELVADESLDIRQGWIVLANH